MQELSSRCHSEERSDEESTPVFPILGAFRLNGQPKRDDGMIFGSCKAIQSPVYLTGSLQTRLLAVARRKMEPVQRLKAIASQVSLLITSGNSSSSWITPSTTLGTSQ